MHGTLAPPPRPLVTVEGVTKTFGGAVTALRDVSLDIHDGEFLTLLGPSGCGKTTLLRLIAGFEQTTSGRLMLDGRDLSGEPPNRRPVNTVFQSYALFPHMSVRDNVAFGLRRLRKPAADIEARVAAMLSLVRLADLADRRPAQLSGGQQQRVALARALAPGPRLLLLDEPLSALDLKLRRERQGELKRLQRDTGITFVLVTHDQEEALSMSDRVAVMSGGVIRQVDTPEALYDRPRDRFVADFIGEANILPASLFGLAGTHVAIRPERVLIGQVGAPATPHAATIADVTFHGSRTTVDATLDAGQPVTVSLTEAPGGLAAGGRIGCGFPAPWLRPLVD